MYLLMITEANVKWTPMLLSCWHHLPRKPVTTFPNSTLYINLVQNYYIYVTIVNAEGWGNRESTKLGD